MIMTAQLKRLDNTNKTMTHTALVTSQQPSMRVQIK
jgi:hypothetical protein